jgi:acetoin utilization protein AcuB
VTTPGHGHDRYDRAGCLTAGGVDVAELANNHVPDMATRGSAQEMAAKAEATKSVCRNCARARTPCAVRSGRSPRLCITAANGPLIGLFDPAGTKGAESVGMSKPIPSVQRFMTTSPHSIGKEQTLERAHEVMRTHRIRHLPVLEGGKLVGIVTERDLHLVETLRDVDPRNVIVEEAMSTHVYAVDPDAPLDAVAQTLAEHKYGSAVVIQNGKVVGIFTTNDACRALADLLHSRLAK